MDEELVVTRTEQSGLSVNDAFWLIVSPRDHGNTASRSLENHLGRSFPTRGEEKYVRPLVLHAQLGMTQPTSKLHVLEPFVSHLPLEFRTQHTFADDCELYVWELCRCSKQQLWTLKRAQRADKQHA